MMASQKPIGIFDSGIGGLSIAKQVSTLLPNEQLIYVADDQNAPYGDKSVEFIQQRAEYICQLLIAKQCKLIVIACNSATVNSVAKLRNRFHIPFVGVEPGIKPAINHTNNGKVAILATEATLSSQSFRRLVDIHKKDNLVFLQPCPGLAELIEETDLSGNECNHMLESYVGPLVSAGVDTIALGCTHYPFVKKNIAALFGEQVHIIDTSAAVAAQVKRLLENSHSLSEQKHVDDCIMIDKPTPEKIKRIHQLWHDQVALEELTG